MLKTLPFVAKTAAVVADIERVTVSIEPVPKTDSRRPDVDVVLLNYADWSSDDVEPVENTLKLSFYGGDDLIETPLVRVDVSTEWEFLPDSLRQGCLIVSSNLWH